MSTLKALKFGSLIVGYLMSAVKIKFGKHSTSEKLKKYCENASHYSELGLKCLNINIKVTGYNRLIDSKKNFLIVSNHMSYLDVLIMSAIQPSVFVTSVDMGEKFFLGTMAEFAGSIFIERRHRGQVEQDLNVMATTLRAGHNVVIYPEGTSTDGVRVLPFKKSLLMSAQAAGVQILPAMLRYQTIDSQPFQRANHKKVCWYGRMSFLPHLLNLLKLQEVSVELAFLEPIDVDQNSSRDELAARSHHAIEKAYLGAEAPIFSSREFLELLQAPRDLFPSIAE